MVGIWNSTTHHLPTTIMPLAKPLAWGPLSDTEEPNYDIVAYLTPQSSAFISACQFHYQKCTAPWLSSVSFCYCFLRRRHAWVWGRKKPAAGPVFSANNQQCALYTSMHFFKNTHKVRTIYWSVMTRGWSTHAPFSCKTNGPFGICKSGICDDFGSLSSRENELQMCKGHEDLPYWANSLKSLCQLTKNLLVHFKNKLVSRQYAKCILNQSQRKPLWGIWL